MSKQPRVTARRITEADLDHYRRLRMNALKLAPEAFGTTYAQVEALSQDDWLTRVRRFAESQEAVCFIAFNDDAPAGIVACFVSETPQMVQMWVEPEHRGNQVGEKLISELKSWVKAIGFREIKAWVRDSNQPAISLYERLGFLPTGKAERDSLNPAINEIEIMWIAGR
ncbi:MAG: GNAT family N-acetyltransferase [Bdellovibrionota bacterium]